MNVKLNSSTMKKVIFNLLIFAPVSMFAQGNFEISGKVIDIMTNQPLFESHVYLNDNYGVLTDDNGLFKLEVPAGSENEKLHISYVGYETYAIPMKDINEDFLKVGLIEEIVMLEEVVVYSNPWNQFKEIVKDISSNYETKEEFYADLFKELKEVEINSELKESEKASIFSGNWSVLVILLTILLTGAFMIRPLIARFNSINTSIT